MLTLGYPRLHARTTGSTNDVARAAAQAGAPHGASVTTERQLTGRGRQGRAWSMPAGRALAVSVVLREHDALLPLRAGLAVADLVGDSARVKWPNDVLLDGRKVAGVLAEGRPQEGWSVLGIGVNVAVDLSELPEDLQQTAGTLGRGPEEIESARRTLMQTLAHRLVQPELELLVDLRARDALRGHEVSWDAGHGTAAGIDAEGRLLVQRPSGPPHTLEAGEVHLRFPLT